MKISKALYRKAVREIHDALIEDLEGELKRKRRHPKVWTKAEEIIAERLAAAKKIKTSFGKLAKAAKFKDLLNPLKEQQRKNVVRLLHADPGVKKDTADEVADALMK